MKQRSPVAAALLSFFIPLYTLYWLVVTASIMRKKGFKVPSAWLLFAPAITVLIIFVLMFAFVSGSDQQTAAAFMGFGYLAFFASIPFTFVYFYKFCKAAEESTHKQVSAGLAFVLLIVVLPVAIYLIQEELNKAGGNVKADQAHPFAVPPAQN